MGVILYQVAVEEFQNNSSAPYPLAEVIIEDTVIPDPSQTVTIPTVVFNVSPEFQIVPPLHNRLPMYEFSEKKEFTDTFINELVQKLEVNIISSAQDKILGKVVTASQGERGLTIYADKGEINYSNSVAPKGNFGIISDEKIEVFKQKADSFVNSLGLQNAAFQYESHAYITTGTGHAAVSETNSRSGDLIQLTYTTRVEDLSIIDKNSDLTPNTITVWLTGEGEIAKFYYQSAGQIGQAFGNYQLLKVDEIKENLETDNTRAKLVNGTYPIGDPIESINVVRARAAYLSVDKYLVPVYILEANVKVAGNRSGTGYLLLDAIKK